MKISPKLILGILCFFIASPFLYAIKFWTEKPIRLHRKGKYDEALALYKKRLASYERFALRTENPEKKFSELTSVALFNIGLILKLKHDFETAETFFTEAKKFGITEDPKNWTGEKPFVIIHK